jgi:hypothetical protein
MPTILPAYPADYTKAARSLCVLSGLCARGFELGLTEQFFDAIDQSLNGKRLDQILHFMPVEKGSDVRIGGEAGNKDESI